MAVRAMFRVAAITHYEAYDAKGVHAKIALEHSRQHMGEGRDPTKWMPSGSLTLHTTNPDVMSQFEVGKEYYLDIIPADAAASEAASA